MVGGSVCKCCLPCCGAELAAHNNKQESIGNPSPPSLLPIQQLHDIEEEEDHQIDQLELLDQQISSSTSLRRKKKHRRQFTNVFNNSPSPTFSVPTPVKSTSTKKVRTRSVTSTTSSDTSGGSVTKMQAEQGSIGDLKSYHNRYLRNRRHTLANVRWVNFLCYVLSSGGFWGSQERPGYLLEHSRLWKLLLKSFRNF